MPSLRYAVLDVFTTKPFAGNQLGVVCLPHSDALTRDQKAAVAREFNFSETVFLSDPPADPADTRRLEIWTPFEELPFAGMCAAARPSQREVSFVR